jgi:5-methylcytosine-specific restriction endonuclease McrA
MPEARRRSFGQGFPTGSSGWAKWARRHPDRAAFYASPAWKWARSQQLLREPNCWCGAKASAVDHIVPIGEGGADLDPDNLQSLCKRHHGPKTLAESHRGMKRAAQRRGQKR